MKSFPANMNWRIHFVHRHDLEDASSRRPAQVLLRSDKFEHLILPLQSEPHRISGRAVHELEQGLPLGEPGEWVACELPVPWVPGRIPVIESPAPLRIHFIEPGELDRRRQDEATESILAALEQDTGASLLSRVAKAEHADRLLGGHLLSVGALLALWTQTSKQEAPELGSEERLRRRLLDAAPSGTTSLQQIWGAPGFERLKLAGEARKSITDAITQAFSRHASLRPGEWRRVREATLWSWWLRSRAVEEGLTGRELSQQLKIDAKALAEIMQGGFAPAPEVRARLPEEDRVLDSFTKSARHPPQEQAAVARIVEAHRPRLSLMSAQLAELERLLGTTERLSKWKSARGTLTDIALRFSPERLQGLPAWERGRLAAQSFRDFLGDKSIDGSLPLDSLFQKTAASPIGMVFPFERLLSEVGMAPGSAPVIGLSPRLIRGSLGAMRFAVAHQLGHLLEHLGGQPRSACTSLAPDDDQVSTEERERFPNAFAMYLLAPRDAVQQLVGTSALGSDHNTYFDAAREVALVFGLSMGAAMPHMINCAVEVESKKQLIARLHQDPRWRAHREAVQNQIETAWAEDRTAIQKRIGDLPEDNVREALRRPRSASFDDYVSQAELQELLTSEVARDLQMA
ncbi:ImmA/IrrE family metallo-endopeptidase [Corallococcus sp. AB030]|uniref:ImmA/IrrE family metallo-endopeptidase n=1 Tax=Corallococcus sp. AB030 TaxID=2316716 RepID=UPI000ED621F8|nr:ImmA/IrrE family metallo-endopeptidase [Corallococcus sp. AB030]RKI09607.1 ImmA/IrrE family metallo-endopeptidase [Corallococcus sp. AB030]